VVGVKTVAGAASNLLQLRTSGGICVWAWCSSRASLSGRRRLRYSYRRVFRWKLIWAYAGWASLALRRRIATFQRKLAHDAPHKRALGRLFAAPERGWTRRAIDIMPEGRWLGVRAAWMRGDLENIAGANITHDMDSAHGEGIQAEAVILRHLLWAFHRKTSRRRTSKPKQLTPFSLPGGDSPALSKPTMVFSAWGWRTAGGRTVVYN